MMTCWHVSSAGRCGNPNFETDRTVLQGLLIGAGLSQLTAQGAHVRPLVTLQRCMHREVLQRQHAAR